MTLQPVIWTKCLQYKAFFPSLVPTRAEREKNAVSANWLGYQGKRDSVQSTNGEKNRREEKRKKFKQQRDEISDAPLQT